VAVVAVVLVWASDAADAVDVAVLSSTRAPEALKRTRYRVPFGDPTTIVVPTVYGCILGGFHGAAAAADVESGSELTIAATTSSRNVPGSPFRASTARATNSVWSRNWRPRDRCCERAVGR
jgi:hypothetical protein